MHSNTLIQQILFQGKLDSILGISYQKMSLEQLKALLIDTELLLTKALEFHEKEKAEYELNHDSNLSKSNYDKCVDNLSKWEIYDKLIEERKRIIEDSYNNLGMIRKFFTISPNGRQGIRTKCEYPHLNNNEKIRIKKIDEKIESLNFDRIISPTPDGYYIVSIKNRIDKLNVLIRKKERAESEKAMVISAKTKTRRIGNEIIKILREQIDKFPDCPYCNKPLGPNPHCDHIHPVTHGGLSKLSNMVYICSSCNLNKKDLTLREFIIEYSLDRNKVEKNLIMMGKRL